MLTYFQNNDIDISSLKVSDRNGTTAGEIKILEIKLYIGLLPSGIYFNNSWREETTWKISPILDLKKNWIVAAIRSFWGCGSKSVKQPISSVKRNPGKLAWVLNRILISMFVQNGVIHWEASPLCKDSWVRKVTSKNGIKQWKGMSLLAVGLLTLFQTLGLEESIRKYSRVLKCLLFPVKLPIL